MLSSDSGTYQPYYRELIPLRGAVLFLHLSQDYDKNIAISRKVVQTPE
jgi:hypothetical protein